MDKSHARLGAVAGTDHSVLFSRFGLETRERWRHRLLFITFLFNGIVNGGHRCQREIEQPLNWNKLFGRTLKPQASPARPRTRRVELLCVDWTTMARTLKIPSQHDKTALECRCCHRRIIATCRPSCPWRPPNPPPPRSLRHATDAWWALTRVIPHLVLFDGKLQEESQEAPL